MSAARESVAGPALDRRTFVASAGALAAATTMASGTLAAPARVQTADATNPGGLGALPPAEPPRRPLNWLRLDRGWRFHLGDISQAVTGHRATVDSAKAGGATGPAAPGYDDTEWRVVDLPHDWVVEGPFDPNANLAQGYRPRGIGWYRRAFRMGDDQRGQHFELQFDGIASHATIWVNGTLAERSWSGYSSSYTDITPYLRFGNQPNVIAVRVDATPNEGWWYEGGGIYRHVWLVARARAHIASDGLFALPRAEPGNAGRWRVPAQVELFNAGDEAFKGAVEIALRDRKGQEIARGQQALTLASLDRMTARVDLLVDEPALWSPAAPVLYEVTAKLVAGAMTLDERSVLTGFRTIRFDAARGFVLNGQPMKIKGACIHQDHAGVGVALPDALQEFRLRRLREMGANAIRVSHHAPTAELLDLADRMGFLVIDENRNFALDEDTLGQLEWLVRRDRNRPGVIAWSIFNEEPWQGTAMGGEMAQRMIAAVKALDTTRPVTAAMHSGLYAPDNVSEVVDLVGLNYQHAEYDRYHAAYPDRPMISTEEGSAFMTRGAWFTDQSSNVFAENDREAARWGLSHRESWKLLAERPHMAGGFVWTGFDYRGEPTPFTWPSASTFFGAMDLCGFAKTGYHIRRALWITERPVLELAPHWTWPGREGEAIPVLAISNAEEVEISLNGRRIARLRVDPYMMAGIDVPYAPGRLEARAFKGGQPVAATAVETAGAPRALRLAPDRPALAADGADAQPVTVFAVDDRGRPVPTANLPVRFAVDGGRIIGLGNGNPNSHEPEKGDARQLFNGLAQVIVQSERGRTGRLQLQATAPGLEPAAAAITVRPARAHPEVPVPAITQLIEGWRQSPSSSERPDAGVAIPDYDVNTWSRITPGDAPVRAEASGWVTLRAQFAPHAALARRGGTIVLAAVEGPAELWLDGKRVAEKTGEERGPMRAAFPPGMGPRTITVIMPTAQGRPYGLVDLVTLKP